MDIQDLSRAIRAGRVLVSNHADTEAENDLLQIQAILVSVLTGTIIKHYPDDKPYPSCLVLSWLDTVNPLHSVWAYNQATRYAVLVTVYRPDPDRWIDWITRKKP